MVGLADIPFLGKFVEKVSDKAVDAVFRSFRYVFRYKFLVNQLNSETENLNIQMNRMSRKIQDEHNNGKTIEDYVLTWQTDAEEIQRSANKLSPSCSCIQSLPIPDPVSRFRIGRNAAKKARAVLELTSTGMNYLTEEIAYLPPVENIPRPDTAFEEFQSRTDTYRELYDALVNEDSPRVHGIYGMPGVGKTRMMEKIWEDAVKEKIFDQVVRVNVGNDFNEMKLQDQIAGRLDCELKSQDMETRASQLKNSLSKRGKILLILDDVWTEIRLGHIIGTSFGSSSKGSKILLTSREKDVCVVNSCQHPVEIKLLSPEEALYMFSNIADPDSAVQYPSTSFQKGKPQSSKSQSPSSKFQRKKAQSTKSQSPSILVSNETLVHQVCAECGHLPLLIQAVGKALRGKSRELWEDALEQLKNGTFERIVGVDRQVYVGIKLSIDFLKDKDAKSCLFLCSMFPEDANIDMRILIMLATSSLLIPNGESRIPAMIDYLKSSSLLLDSGEDNETKVHDTIRNVARSIAFTDSDYAFLQVTCNSAYLPRATYRSRRFLRLDAETADVHFYEDLECLTLRSLWLQTNDLPQKFSGGFFRMFVNLSFLMLQNVDISLEQFSLQRLSNLETLILLECDISRTDVSLFPKKVETLCIWHCDLPWPLDVANLENLRKLEIQQNGKLVMKSNVISSLSSLEKLHIPNGFIFDTEEYRIEPVVMEFSNLTRLRSLQFHFDDDITFQDRNIFSHMVIDRYNIIVGAPKMPHSQKRVPSTRSIELYGKQSQSWDGLMASAEVVMLEHSKIEVSSICNGYTNAFEDLKALYIKKCHYMRYLATTSEIWYGLQQATCFSKLTILEIIRCSGLKYLFCNNIAKSLLQLQELRVNDCGSMEAIILNDGTSDGEIINFPRLLSVTILNSVGLASFYTQQNPGSTSSVDPTAQYQPFFHGKVSLPSLKKLDMAELEYTSVIWGNDFYNEEVTNLEYIEVYHCNNLRSMFPPSIASNLAHLKELSVHFCEKMREIIEEGEQVIPDDCILFPELTYLRLYGLPSLTRFYRRKANTCKVTLRVHQLSSIYLADLPALQSFFHGSDFEFHLPALKVVQVINCGLSTLFTFSLLRNFQLEYLEVRDCALLENIVEDLRDDETCSEIITLSQLTAVALENLPNLKSSFHNANYEFQMPAIKKVTVFDCGLISTVFTSSVFQNLKQLKELSVRNCKLLESIFEDSSTDETLDTSEKIITLYQVSTVYLEGLPKFKSIFYSATYKCYMPALKNVTIIGCGLSVLFTSSVFREIQKLEQLYVSDCKSLEHIVEEVAGDETSEINGQSIKSIELSLINLVSLPSLKSFSCTLSYVFNMPKLHTLELTECPQIEYFSSFKTNTRAVRVTIDGCSEEGIQDLDDYIRQNRKSGSYSNYCVGESSYSSQHLGTKSERIEEEKPQETETDQPDS